MLQFSHINIRGAKRWLLLMGALCVLAVSGAQAQEPVQDGQHDALLDRIAAVVGEDVITERELLMRLQLTEMELVQRGISVPRRQILLRQVMERLVLERLQLQEARRLGITIDEIALNRTLEDIARDNNLTLLQLRNALAADNVDFTTFREQIRDEMTIAQLRRRQVDQRLRVSDHEIDELIAAESGAIDRAVRYRLRHILIALPQGADPPTIADARKRAEDVLVRVQAGESFAELAAQFSDAPEALEGGELGWRTPAQIPTLFARAVILMRPGETSTVLRSTAGFHLLQLVEREGDSAEMIEQARVRHILVAPSEIRSEDEALRQLAGLREQLELGADFAVVARTHSDDPGSAARGGDLGWVNPGDMVPEFENAMQALPPRRLSEPVLSGFGWHLIEVLERREVDMTQDVLRARAREILQNRKREDETELWLRRLRDDAFVEYRIGGLEP